MVLPRSENVHDVVTGGQDTVAIRVPSHPMAQQLLTAFGGGIAGPFLAEAMRQALEGIPQAIIWDLVKN